MARSFRTDKPQNGSYIDTELPVPLLSRTAYLQLLCINCLHLWMTSQVNVAVRATRRSASRYPLLPMIVVI
jgi:hypothetical protein